MDHGMHGHDHAAMMANMSGGDATTMAPVGHQHMNHDSHSSHGDHGSSHAATNGGHNMPHSGMDHSMMKMYFHASDHATILFSFWKTDSWEGMLGSCLAIFVMALLYEGLKVLREHLLRRSNVMVRYNTVPVATSEDVMISETHKTVGARLLSLAHLVQTLLHILQVVVSYFLMLIFMTYNIYLCIAVALGAGAGYFCFGWKRAIVVDVNEHCH